MRSECFGSILTATVSVKSLLLMITSNIDYPVNISDCEEVWLHMQCMTAVCVMRLTTRHRCQLPERWMLLVVFKHV